MGVIFIFSDVVKPIEVVVDRIEGNIIVIELDKGYFITLEKRCFPSIKEGDVLEISKNDKKVFINKKKTKKRKKKVSKLMDKVFR